MVWPDGSVHWLIGRFQAFKDLAGKPLRLVGANVDITARKRAEEALHQSEERFRALVTASSDVIYQMSPDWSEMRRLRGREFIADTEEPCRTWLQKYIYPEDQPQMTAAINKAIRTKSIFELEHRVRRLDGTVGWAFSRAVPLLDTRAEIVEWFGAAIDVTQRKQAEQALRQRDQQEAQEALRQSEERFRTMANAIPQLAWIAQPDGYVFWYNQRWYEYTGTTLEQMQGWGWQSVMDPQVLPEILEQWRRSLATGQPFDMEFPLRGADGCFRPFLTRCMPLKDNEGRVTLWFGTNTDVTDQHQAREALRQSEERFRTMANAIPQLAWMAQPDGYIFWFNRRAYEYTGATPQQLQGWGWQSLVDSEVLPKVLEQWRRSIATGEPFDMEFPLRGADGRFRPFLTRCMPFQGNEGRVALWFGTNTDVTALKEAQALRQSEDRLRTLIEQAPTAIGVSRNGITLYANQKYVEMFGFQNADEYAGRPVLDHWTPESRAIIAEHVRQRSLGLPAPATYEGVAQRQDGSRFPAHVDVAVVNLSDGPASLAFITDITERKRLQEHLEEAVEERTAKLHEALAELEHMSYSMVHDMRAPLRAMQSFAGMLQEECAGFQQPPALDYLQRIRDSSNRLDRLITDALNYNKVVRENLPMTRVPLAELLRGMVKSYPNLHPPAADITMDLDDLVVLGNEALLTQCFGNLLDNAVKFVAPGVPPRIRIWAEPSTLNSQPSTLICIQDNGIGIPKEAHEKIFGMFQRMHHESERPGTGIGLAIVKKAVERMNGRVGVESEPGKGSTFWIELPKPAQAQCQERLRAAA